MYLGLLSSDQLVMEALALRSYINMKKYPVPWKYPSDILKWFNCILQFVFSETSDIPVIMTPCNTFNDIW